MKTALSFIAWLILGIVLWAILGNAVFALLVLAFNPWFWVVVLALWVIRLLCK